MQQPLLLSSLWRRERVEGKGFMGKRINRTSRGRDRALGGQARACIFGCSEYVTKNESLYLRLAVYNCP